MPGSSGTTQSMKKTIGHRGVETTTGETTYKKVRAGLWWFFDTHDAELQRWKVEEVFGVCILKLVWEFLSLDSQE